MTHTLEPVLDHLASRQPQIEAWLKTFLRIPSVSADPAYAASMDDTRRFLCERLRAEGLQQVQLLDGGGEAAVYGEWMGAPGRPTLLIYGHYDVQPADP
ncbi:MAG: peptidase M20, partial [Achromobacter spanius]